MESVCMVAVRRGVHGGFYPTSLCVRSVQSAVIVHCRMIYRTNEVSPTFNLGCKRQSLNACLTLTVTQPAVNCVCHTVWLCQMFGF